MPCQIFRICETKLVQSNFLTVSCTNNVETVMMKKQLPKSCLKKCFNSSFCAFVVALEVLKTKRASLRNEFLMRLSLKTLAKLVLSCRRPVVF